MTIQVLLRSMSGRCPPSESLFSIKAHLMLQSDLERQPPVAPGDALPELSYENFVETYFS